MQLYMSWYIRSFFGFTFLNILYFFKHSCTNIFHRRSLHTFYYSNIIYYCPRFILYIETDLSTPTGKCASSIFQSFQMQGYTASEYDFRIVKRTKKQVFHGSTRNFAWIDINQNYMQYPLFVAYIQSSQSQWHIPINYYWLHLLRWV